MTITIYQSQTGKWVREEKHDNGTSIEKAFDTREEAERTQLRY